MKHDRKDSEAAINAFAYRIMRRLASVGERSLTIEDVKQELWIAWCIATQNYDAECGVPFLAYLRTGMRLHMNRYIEKNVQRRFGEVHAASLDAPVTEDGSTLGEIVPSADPAPDSDISERSQIDFAMKHLSPRAQIFVRILNEQPLELLEEVRKIEMKCNHARENGVTVPFVNRLSTTMVFDLMDASRTERLMIAKEIKDLGSMMREMDF